jgi:hypothetical protein
VLNTEVRVSRCADNAPRRAAQLNPKQKEKYFISLYVRGGATGVEAGVNLGIWLRNIKPLNGCTG